jgi:hypothetical protein
MFFWCRLRVVGVAEWAKYLNKHNTWVDKQTELTLAHTKLTCYWSWRRIWVWPYRRAIMFYMTNTHPKVVKILMLTILCCLMYLWAIADFFLEWSIIFRHSRKTYNTEITYYKYKKVYILLVCKAYYGLCNLWDLTNLKFIYAFSFKF